MDRGIVVLTGTDRISRYKQNLPALFRRVHYEVSLAWMTKDNIKSFFQHFLSRFVYDCPEAEWIEWADTFVCEKGPWSGSRNISVDMVKQYLMCVITCAFCDREFRDAERGRRRIIRDGEFRIDKRDEFFRLVCDAERGRTFLEAYAVSSVKKLLFPNDILF